MRRPHVLLDLDEVRAAVKDLRGEREFVVDVETTKTTSARSNRLIWIGLGAAGRNYLIPVGHPKGVLLTPERRIKTPAYLLYPADDPRSKTKLGKPSQRLVEHPVAATFGEPPKQLYPHDVCAAIEPLMWSDRAKIGHNLKFDLMSLAKYYDHEIPPGPYHDTIIIRHCLAEDLREYGLKDLTGDWFKIPWKRRAKWYPNLGEKGIENYALDVVARYLAKDLRYAWMMKQAFFPLLAKRGVQETYDFEMSMYPSVMAAEYAGFPVDTSKMGIVRAELERRQKEIKEEAWEEAGDAFSLNHTDSKRWIMFGEGKREFGLNKRPLKTQALKVRDRTKETKLPSVTQSVLEYYRDHGNRMAELFLDWSLTEKLRGTFVEGLSGFLYERDDGLPTIHTSFKQHGTVTGRFSSSEPNLQQLPRGTVIRDMFVAGPGHVLIVADYDQIELRCLAYAAREPRMIKIFRQRRDIHAEATVTAMQIPRESVTGDLRQVGKTLNFATGYGAGAERIAAVAGVSVKRGQQFLDRYYDEFSALEPWKADLLTEARLRCDMTDPMRHPPYVDIPISHRRRRLPDLMPILAPSNGAVLRAERQAVNAYVQGFAANIAKTAMRQLHVELLPFSAQIVAQVHDEIIVRVKETAATEALEVTQRVMSGVRDAHGEPILGEIPLVVSAATGQSWAEAKH